MNRIVTLLLLGSLLIPIETRAAEDLGVIVLGPEEELAERLTADGRGRAGAEPHADEPLVRRAAVGAAGLALGGALIALLVRAVFFGTSVVLLDPAGDDADIRVTVDGSAYPCPL